jgi:dehydrogenase/reductase SDR family protein 7B
MSKTLLITGASSGIGKALAEQFAVNGNTLLLAARNQAVLQEVKQSCESKGATVHIFQTDLSNMKEVETLANAVSKTVSQIDILINNAGISQRSQAEKTSEEVDRSIMELNFFSPVKLTKLVWPLLVNSKHANIVNISSVTGTFGFPQRSAYAASKHAMEGFFESWMLENKQPHIHFTIVAPGRILTNISFNALKNDGTKHQVLDEGQAKGIKAEVCAARIAAGHKAQQTKGIYCAARKNIIVFTPLFSCSFCFFGEKIRLKIMQQLISGIQQVGIGIPDAGQYFTWFRRTFGFDVKIFDDEAQATLMTRYTGGEVHARRAILAMNMNGGGGAEIWQFTSRPTNYPTTPVHFGDYGINAVKIKCNNVEQAYSELQKQS